MAKSRSCLLVIDASIAMAAGETSMHPTSRNCREFLQSVLAVCHRMVLTKPIQDEWNKHQSGFARKWRASMMARKKITFAEIAPGLSLEETIRRVVTNASHAAILEKDRHLIEAAIAADKRVASLDDAVRECLRQNGRKLPGVVAICWVNPDKPDERAITWLESGAAVEKHRTLGYTLPDSDK